MVLVGNSPAAVGHQEAGLAEHHAELGHFQKHTGHDPQQVQLVIQPYVLAEARAKKVVETKTHTHLSHLETTSL